MAKLISAVLMSLAFLVSCSSHKNPVGLVEPDEPAAKLVISKEKAAGKHDRLPPSSYWGFAAKPLRRFSVYENQVRETTAESVYPNSLYTVGIWPGSAGKQFGIALSGERGEVFVVSGIPGQGVVILTIGKDNGGTPLVPFTRWEGNIIVRPAGDDVRASVVFRLDAGGEVTPAFFIPGDVKVDGEINAADGLFLLQYLNDKRGLTTAQLAAADMDGDGEITRDDAQSILEWSASH